MKSERNRTSDLAAAAQPTLLISLTEAATIAGLSKSVAYRLAALDEFPGLVRLPGCQLLVRRRVLEAWLAGGDAPRPSAPVPRWPPWPGRASGPGRGGLAPSGATESGADAGGSRDGPGRARPHAGTAGARGA